MNAPKAENKLPSLSGTGGQLGISRSGSVGKSRKPIRLGA